MAKKRQRVSKLENHWGHRLQKAMKDKKLGVREVARTFDLSPSVISGWLKGNSPSDLILIKSISDHLDVSFTWLLTGSHEKNSKISNLSEIFNELPYFDGYARIRIDRLIPRKPD